MFSIKESYEEIQLALNEILCNLEAISTLKEITVEGKTYPIKFYLGGDLKFLALVLGINAANSKRPCIWCFSNKKHFCNYKKIFSIRDKILKARTLKHAKKRYLKKAVKDRLGYTAKSLVNFIEFDDVVVDVLHLNLRISDKLMDLLIRFLISID